MTATRDIVVYALLCISVRGGAGSDGPGHPTLTDNMRAIFSQWTPQIALA
jgi:hypothetical protein